MRAMPFARRPVAASRPSRRCGGSSGIPAVRLRTCSRMRVSLGASPRHCTSAGRRVEQRERGCTVELGESAGVDREASGNCRRSEFRVDVGQCRKAPGASQAQEVGTGSIVGALQLCARTGITRGVVHVSAAVRTPHEGITRPPAASACGAPAAALFSATGRDQGGRRRGTTPQRGHAGADEHQADQCAARAGPCASTRPPASRRVSIGGGFEYRCRGLSCSMRSESSRAGRVARRSASGALPMRRTRGAAGRRTRHAPRHRALHRCNERPARGVYDRLPRAQAASSCLST